MSVRLAGTMLLALAALGVGGTFARGADEPKQDQPGGPAVIKLAAPAKHPVVAADGRVLVMHLPEAKQIAVFDVKEGKVVKSLPAPDDDILLAGGLDYVFVMRTSNNTVQRWSLATFEKEATVRLPVDKTFEQVCMGCASNGPPVLRLPNFPSEGRLVLLNPITVREVPTTGYLPAAGDYTESVFPDGQGFAWRTTGIREVAVMRAIDGKFAAKTIAADLYDLQPGPAGRFLYTSSRAYDEQAGQLYPAPGVIPKNLVTPAVQWPIFLESERVPGPR